MIKNFVKIALRNISKNKLYAFINIAGLAIGMASAILILFWVQDELSYDSFNVRANQLYRVNWDFKWNGTEGVGPGTPPPLAGKMLSDVPEVVAATRLRPMLRTVVREGDRFFDEEGIVAADSNFLELFTYPLISGNPETALKEPNSVVLTESMAHKYFGDVSPVGKNLVIGEDEKNFYGVYQSLFKVTGVVRDVPHNSQIQFDMLTSMSSYPEVAWRNWSWVWMQMATYIQLRKGVSASVVQPKITELERKYLPAGLKRLGYSYDDMLKSGGHWHFVLQPLTDVYLGSSLIGNRLGPLGSRTQVYLLSIIAVLILAIACINFMNLTTARSGSRAKEISVRKVLGSARKNLVVQFLVESILLSSLALTIAVFVVEIVFPLFNKLTGKNLVFNLFYPWWLMPSMMLIGLFVGIVSGSYPALYLSSLEPVAVVKGGGKFSSRKMALRDILVVAQFAIAIGLITCTLLVKKQMDFVRKADLGFNRDGLMVISNENARLGAHAEAFRDRLKAHSQIIDASISTGVPPSYGFEDGYEIEGKEDRKVDLLSYMTDDNFINTMQLKIVKGRGFEKGYNDSASVILNEAAVKDFGFTEPIGKYVTYLSNNVKYRVIGVVKDFNFMDMYSPITPFALFNKTSKSYSIPNSFVVVRVRPDDLKETISTIKSEWEAVAPDMPFEYSFLDNNFEKGYDSAERLGNVFLVFSFLTIFVACLGLFALAAFAAEQRTKEIGVRKVLGASVADIVFMLSREFTRWILVANIVAWPLAYYVMNNWLQEFAFRAQIGIWVFVIPGLAAFIIALLTVSSHAIKAATANPIESLRYE